MAAQPPEESRLESSHHSLAHDLPAPRRRSRTTPLDLIFIEGFVGETVIGIHDERAAPRRSRCVIDVHAGVPRARACDTDRIADTIDYGAVRERLHRLLAEHQVQLLEAFAEAIADILIDEFGARLGARARGQAAQVRRRATPSACRSSAARAAPRRRRARGAAVLHLIGSGMVPGKR